MRIFGSNAGRVIALNTDDGIPVVLSVGGLSSDTVLLMSMGLSQKANVQFMPTLLDSIYIYAFGEHPGSVVINGAAFWQSCGGGRDGLLDVLDYYKENSVASTHSPVQLSLGVSKRVISGFLNQVSVTAQSPETGMSVFALNFVAIPLRSGGST